MDNSLLDDLRAVAPAEAIAHAEARKWIRVSTSRSDVALFNHPAGGLKQVVVPLDQTVEDYARRIADVVDRFAEEEQRPLIQVINNLVARSSDVLRFRVAIPGYEGGSLPLSEGLRLYNGVVKSLMAAARSVINPQKVYDKVSINATEEFVNRCRLGQTEKGSYIATVACPMNTMPERIKGEVPFSRQTTALLLNTMATMATAIEAGKEDDLLAIQDENIVVSSNLCEAIALMQPEDDRGYLDVQCSWSPTAYSDVVLVDKVIFTGKAAPALSRIAQKLKSHAPEPYVEFQASIEGLKSEPDVAKRQLGEISVKISDEGKLKIVRMEVTPEDYASACLAHRDGKGLSFKAQLIRGVRLAKIGSYREFKVLDHLPIFSSPETSSAAKPAT